MSGVRVGEGTGEGTGITAVRGWQSSHRHRGLRARGAGNWNWDSARAIRQDWFLELE